MEFYTYTHARPDGSIFYVGKGTGRRARDFSPKRRTAHHRNIAVKYGIRAILVKIYPANTEDDAFRMEREMIRDLRLAGVTLINRTNGGEGASGVKSSEARNAGLMTGRLSWDQRGLSQDSIDRILVGMAKGRAKASEWRRSEDGISHIKSLGMVSAAATAARAPIQKICEVCRRNFETKSLKKVRWCSKPCGLRGWRMDKAAKPRIAAFQNFDPAMGLLG